MRTPGQARPHPRTYAIDDRELGLVWGRSQLDKNCSIQPRPPYRRLPPAALPLPLAGWKTVSPFEFASHVALIKKTAYRGDIGYC